MREIVAGPVCAHGRIRSAAHLGFPRARRLGDAARLRDDYVPSGFKGVAVNTRSVPGHEFGLKLPPGDKKALIAFLRTL